MAIPVPLEVERVVNLVRGFGWSKIEEKIIGDKILITLEKKTEVKLPGTPT
jgi:hypothetical protein